MPIFFSGVLACIAAQVPSTKYPLHRSSHTTLVSFTENLPNFKMQAASQILAVPLPVIRHAKGSLHPSVSSEFLHETFMQPWTTFEQDVRLALRGLDLNFEVPHNDFAGDEIYLVGNETGLSGRFVNNVCIPVARILTHSSQPHFVIGDIQSFMVTPPIVPDVSVGITITSDSITQIKIVGEFKTWWTLEIDQMSISDRVSRVALGPHLGKLSYSCLLIHCSL